ncbi:MAG TPA: branched-chain amino acid ABC transporter permease [Casimicrobiaceae bacterium]|nr:branched-chain amino acid ABC transporter permease [Casimicrobiaceae bacterium]
MSEADAVASALATARRDAPLGRERAVWIAIGAILLVLPYVPGLASDFGRSLLSQMGIAAVFALSFNVLFGQTGLLSFGHAVYFGLGGYAAIHFMRAINHGLPIPIALVPLAGAASGLVSGLLIGTLTTRRAGTIFALISLGVGELVYAATFMLPSIFGGEEGITASRTRAPALFGLDFGSQVQVYYLVACWALVAAALMRAFIGTPVGRLCNAVRDNPERAQFIGYDPQRVRFIASAVAGLFAGLAGGLHAINYEIVAADAVGAQRSGTVLVMAYLGGTGYFAGPVFGAVVLTWLQTSLSAYTSAWLLYVGLVFMAVIMFAPSGLCGLAVMHGPILRTRAFRRLVASYAVALLPAIVMIAGAALMIEMSYRLSTQRELGTVLKFGPVAADAATVPPWIVGVLLLAGGFLMFRATWHRVAATWHAAVVEAANATSKPLASS